MFPLRPDVMVCVWFDVPHPAVMLCNEVNDTPDAAAHVRNTKSLKYVSVAALVVPGGAPGLPFRSSGTVQPLHFDQKIYVKDEIMCRAPIVV